MDVENEADDEVTVVFIWDPVTLVTLVDCFCFSSCTTALKFN